MSDKTTIQWTDAQKIKARSTVNVEVRFGRMPRPNDLACVDCGHRHEPGNTRHEYDHHHGYDAAHALDVEPVCAHCQRARAMARGEIDRAKLKSAAAVRSARRKIACARGHPMMRFTDGKWRCHECRLAYWRTRRNERRAHV